jgi:hypothetical protein
MGFMQWKMPPNMAGECAKRSGRSVPSTSEEQDRCLTEAIFFTPTKAKFTSWSQLMGSGTTWPLPPNCSNIKILPLPNPLTPDKRDYRKLGFRTPGLFPIFRHWPNLVCEIFTRREPHCTVMSASASSHHSIDHAKRMQKFTLSVKNSCDRFNYFA